jgi:PKD domain
MLQGGGRATVGTIGGTALAVALWLALALPAAASAAPEWAAAVSFPVPASDVFEGKPSTPPQIAYQNGGVATEAFLEIASLSPLKTAFHVGAMAPGSAYADQLTVASSETGVPAGGSIAVAANGAAVAVWTELVSASLEAPVRYRASYRPAGSASWEAPVTLITDTERSKELPTTLVPVIASNGAAAVGIQHIASGEQGAGQKQPLDRIDVAAHPAGGGWHAAVRITPEKVSAESLTLSTDGNGNLTAAYAQRFSEGGSSSTSDDRYTVVVRRLSAASGEWGPEEDLSGLELNHSAFAVHLAEDEAGDAVVTYQFGEVGIAFDVWAVTRQGPNGSWTAATEVVHGVTPAPTAAGVAPNGTAYILYRFTGTSSGEDCEGVIRGPAGGAFSTPRCVSPTNLDTSSGSIAFLEDDAYFAWRGNVPGEPKNASIQGARWANGNSLPDVAHNLDPSGSEYGSPVLVPDDQGSVVAFYTNSTPGQLRAAAYDGGPPILLSAAVPSTAIVGQPVTFSAAFVDLWSGLGAGQPTWSFGDGSAAASGGATTHAFSTPGSYVVTLTARDALGNTTSSTYRITVNAPQVPSGLPVPVISALKQSHSVWLGSNALARISSRGHKRKPPVGTTFSFSLNETAAVSFRFTQTVAGRLVGHKCVAPTRKNGRRKSCRRIVTVATLSFPGHAGRDSLFFAGRVSRKMRLRPGRYTVVVVAKNAAGVSSAAQSLSFTIAG